MTTPDEITQAADHLVTVKQRLSMPTGEEQPYVWEETMTGVLKDPQRVGEDVTFDVYTGYHVGTYDHADPEPLGYTEGWRVSLANVIEFTDHGGRADALLAISQHDATVKHTLAALKDAEANLARSFQSLTNLAAQEG